MSVKLSVPTHLLSRPEIAEAVQSLILVLGGREVPARQAAPAAKQPPKLQAPTEQSVAPAEARRPAPTAVPLGAPAVELDDAPSPVDMSLEAFFDGLPVNSQRFLGILQEKGVVKVEEMVDRLGLKNAKAVGGITGAIGRWGPVRGVDLPYERFILDGVRAWKWTGPVMARGIPPAEKPTRKAAAKKAPRRASKPAVKAAAAPSAKPAPARSDASATVDDMLANLSPKALRLAEVLRERGRLGRGEAASAAGADNVSEVSDLIREINASAKHLGQSLASDNLDLKGNVTYSWLGLKAPAPKPAEVASDTTDTVVSKGGLIRRRRKV